MKFKEFEPGVVVHHGPVTVNEAEMLAFSRAYDPQWFHVDPERARQGRWGGLIASGWMTCGLAMRMAVESALHDSESFGSPGLDRLRWMHPVRPGDQLRLEATVDSKRVSSTREDLGIIRWTWRLFNQDGIQVLEVEATSLFELEVPSGKA
ncbi:MaoC family dehydratase [Castellaniella defragrans]|jgi:acyl dehydratase|uniref:Acyl dehydratase n=2 Tax=Castellaniella defragrans TaxID=75697 RepID=W8X014_CASD6|nr:MaoC family dehydratase [Castellaniella defragrans]KAB0600803.1 MaoC family dehydratase [Castellaniella defragrans]MBB6083247.1 acyl dehydratase [Castellaniella defragrans]CDM25393.1 Acyl dehydratase [Castellaniella defragrans 65Phen]